MTVTVAAASWRLVEEPALRLKRLLPRPRRDPRAPEALLAPATAG